jgi:two-component system sensor histidine kinase DegS
MPLMRRNPTGGLTIKAALILGFGLTLAIWLVTGYQFAESMATAEEQATAIASRYVQAQDLLASLRTQVLASSGIARDALLDRTQQSLEVSRDQLENRLTLVRGTIASYVRVMNSVAERERLERLEAEALEFSETLNEALQSPPDDGSTGTQRFSGEVLPRRTALLRATEDLQTLNRAAFVQYRRDMAELQSSAERSTRAQLGIALLCGLAIAVAATLYAGRLEKRLVSQLVEDALKTRALQDLSLKIIRAQEDERRRIAHELHDEVGQALTAIKVELTLAERAAGPAGGIAPDLLQSAKKITDGALHTVRDLSHLLHPAVLDDLGLPEAIDSHLRDFSKRYGVRTEIKVNGLETRLPPDVEVAAYRMVQEAMTNVAKHAHATRCEVRLDRSDDRFEVRITDDGDGFTPSSTVVPRERRGLGLIGIRERALQLAGVVAVESAPGKGTVVRISLPPTTLAVTSVGIVSGAAAVPKTS